MSCGHTTAQLERGEVGLDEALLLMTDERVLTAQLETARGRLSETHGAAGAAYLEQEEDWD